MSHKQGRFLYVSMLALCCALAMVWALEDLSGLQRALAPGPARNVAGGLVGEGAGTAARADAGICDGPANRCVGGQYRPDADEPPKLAAPSQPASFTPPADWWATVQAGLRAQSYEFNALAAADGTVGYRAFNLANRWAATFTADGIQVAKAQLPTATSKMPGSNGGAMAERDDAESLASVRRDAATAAWSFNLRLAGYGYAANLQPLGSPTQISAAGNHIEYRYGTAISEWYFNDERGLEQGFTLEAPPLPSGEAETGSERLSIALAVSGDLAPQLSDDGQSISFADAGGQSVLHYAQLAVRDATGSTLPAELQVTSGKSQFAIRIVIDSTSAVFPLSVDPLLSTPALTLTGENTNNYFGYSVATTGDVNGDGYADVVVGAYGYNSLTGRAYVYYGSAAGLSATPALTLTGENPGDQFGFSVATAGGVNGDGYSDVVVGLPGSLSGTGRVYVYHGSPAGLSATPALTLTGENPNDAFGSSVATAGDVNGDGYADLVVGADGSNSLTGRAYVYHGSAAVGLRLFLPLIMR
jgi:hypothetical protein